MRFCKVIGRLDSGHSEFAFLLLSFGGEGTVCLLGTAAFRAVAVILRLLEKCSILEVDRNPQSTSLMPGLAADTRNQLSCHSRRAVVHLLRTRPCISMASATRSLQEPKLKKAQEPLGFRAYLLKYRTMKAKQPAMAMSP